MMRRFAISLLEVDFTIANHWRFGLEETLHLSRFEAFDIRLVEIHAKGRDADEVFEYFLSHARKQATAANKPDLLWVHAYGFPIARSCGANRFNDVYTMCTAHMGPRLVGTLLKPIWEPY